MKQAMSKEQRTWYRIIARCHDEAHHRYLWYGARGITVCDRWRASFADFLADMGKAPTPRHTIERKDNDKGYCKGNCRWATMKEQAQNRRNNVRLTYKGTTKTIAEWADHLKMDRRVIWKRIDKGWSVERTIEEPKAARKPRTIKFPAQTRPQTGQEKKAA